MIKSEGITLALPRYLAAYATYKSPTIDVSQEISGSVYLQFATKTSISASVEFRIEAESASGVWHPIQRFKTNTFPPAIATIVNVTGTTVTTNNTFYLDPGDTIFTEHQSNIELSEWGRIVGRTDSALIVLDQYQNPQNGSIVYDSGELFVATLDLVSISSIRLVADASSTNNATVFAGYLNTGKI
jgi:hypothetical protein